MFTQFTLHTSVFTESTTLNAHTHAPPKPFLTFSLHLPGPVQRLHLPGPVQRHSGRVRFFLDTLLQHSCCNFVRRVISQHHVPQTRRNNGTPSLVDTTSHRGHQRHAAFTQAHGLPGPQRPRSHVNTHTHDSTDVISHGGTQMQSCARFRCNHVTPTPIDATKLRAARSQAALYTCTTPVPLRHGATHMHLPPRPSQAAHRSHRHSFATLRASTVRC